MSNLVKWPRMYDPFGEMPMEENMLDPDEIREATGWSSQGKYSDEEWENMHYNLVGIFTNMQDTIPQLVNPTVDIVNDIFRTQWSRIYDIIVLAVRRNQKVDSQVADVIRELNERFTTLFSYLNNTPLSRTSAFASPSAVGSKYTIQKKPMFMQVLEAIPKRASSSSSSASSSSVSSSSASSSSASSSSSLQIRRRMRIAEIRRIARLRVAEGRRSSVDQSRIDEIRRRARERAMRSMPGKRRKTKLRF